MNQESKAVKKVAKNEALIYYRKDGAPTARFGKLPNGEIGYIIANQERHIFGMDNVIRKQRQTKESLKKLIEG